LTGTSRKKRYVKERFTRDQVATAVAVLFHTIGLVGLLYFDRSFFIQSTSFNLLLMFALLLWTQKEKNKYYFFFYWPVFQSGSL